MHCEESREFREDDLVIAILGPTGAGKSNIIDNLTGQLGTRAGHGLQSCTTKISAVRIKNHPQHKDRVILVDTPGFDDTNKSDLQILQIIGEWLVQLCNARVSLYGILYLHRITDIRLSGAHSRILSMFEEVCGSEAAKTVLFVTTMWDEIDDAHLGERREEVLRNTYWSTMLGHGASTARFLNTEKSAWDLVDNTLAKSPANVTLKLQQEMVGLRKPLDATAAAKKLEPPYFMEGVVQSKQSYRKLTRKQSWWSHSSLPGRQTEAHFKKRDSLDQPLSEYMNRSQVKEVKTEDLCENDFLIAVMGPTGSGKSTFIDIATGLDAGRHGQRQDATDISIFKLSIPDSNYNLVFVNVPGLDDTDKSDADTLKMTAEWLAKIYRENILFSGILYFHPISDNRMASSSMKNLRIFEALCGKKMFQNVILTTTRWDDMDDDIANTREEQLRKMYWGPMLEHGSIVKRFRHTKESAFQVFETLFRPANYPQPLLVQQEMVDMYKELNETSAGKRLFSDLKGLMRAHQVLIQQMQSQLNRPQAVDSGSLLVLKEEYQELKAVSGFLAQNMRQLDLSFGQRLTRAVGTAFNLKLRH